MKRIKKTLDFFEFSFKQKKNIPKSIEYRTLGEVYTKYSQSKEREYNFWRYFFYQHFHMLKYGIHGANNHRFSICVETEEAYFS